MRSEYFVVRLTPSERALLDWLLLRRRAARAACGIAGPYSVSALVRDLIGRDAAERKKRHFHEVK